MDSDKHSGGDFGGPGWQQRGGQPDSPSEPKDPRFTTFEQDCLDELELESAEDEAGTRSDGGSSISKEDFVDTWSSQQSSHRLWLAFQHTASSISSLYRDQCTTSSTASTGTGGASWYSFQTAAEACTDMYKESQEILRLSVDDARREGRKQLVKELVMWVKKRGRRGRHFRREELLAFLSGKTLPPASMRPPSTGSSGSGVVLAPSPSAASGYHHHHHRKSNAILSSPFLSDSGSGSGAIHSRRSLSASPSLTDANAWLSNDFNNATTGYYHDGKNDNNNTLQQQSMGLFLEPDLRTFRDAQAVQGLSGALSNIRVAGSPHSPHGGGRCTTPPHLLGATGGASPLRHTTASPFDNHHYYSHHRVRSSTPSGRHTPVSVPSSSSATGRVAIHAEDALPFDGIEGSSGVISGENADPSLTAPHGYRKRAASQSSSSHENYHASSMTADSPTRKRHRLV